MAAEQVAPSRGRGLKLRINGITTPPPKVAPSRGRGLKRVVGALLVGMLRRSLTGGRVEAKDWIFIT